MPKSGVDGPTYAGHVNVAPDGEPEWVLEQDAPAAVVATSPAPVVAEPVDAKPHPRRRTRT